MEVIVFSANVIVFSVKVIVFSANVIVFSVNVTRFAVKVIVFTVNVTRFAVKVIVFMAKQVVFLLPNIVVGFHVIYCPKSIPFSEEYVLQKSVNSIPFIFTIQNG